MTNYLPSHATTPEACEWLATETGEPWTLVRILEHGLTPRVWLDYTPGWPAIFGDRTEGFLAPLVFGGDLGRLSVVGTDVLITMTKVPSGEFIRITPGIHASIDELRFLRDDITRLAGKHYKPEDTPAAKGEAAPATNTNIEAWRVNARQIGKGIHKEKESLNVERIAEKTYKEMTRRHDNGESGMTGRGGKVPAADTIKRWALTGIKA